ncbi:hypothetical protein C2845_PM12G30820 [Panicum miliaceum]|uniref:Uncharacterized protein n=1 Tax=Panicum miliaceum TaxID=4540 RepID=A0A3L6QLW3_PANMI|nr:hypothetical protein C2845_PM12G30820 [Panicum miliaceum]
MEIGRNLLISSRPPDVVKRVVWERESTAAAGGRRRAQAPRPPRVGSACRQERAPRSPRARALPQRTRSARPPESWATPRPRRSPSERAARASRLGRPLQLRPAAGRHPPVWGPSAAPTAWIDLRRSGSVDFAARSALPARRVAGRRRRGGKIVVITSKFGGNHLRGDAGSAGAAARNHILWLRLRGSRKGLQGSCSSRLWSRWLLEPC